MIDDLFNEFMTEVYAENLRKGNLQLTPVDYRSFYREGEVQKIFQNGKIIRLNGLLPLHQTNLIETGLVRGEKNMDE